MGIKKLIADNLFDFAYAVAYRRIPEQNPSSFPAGSGNFRLLKPTLRYWYADPLIATVEERDFLFMEVFDRKKHKGLIGVSSFDENGRLSSPEIILEEDFHLSFPLVFFHAGEWILMPECADSGSLRFYSLNPKTFKTDLICSVPVPERIVDTVVLSADENGLVLLGCIENVSNPKQTSLVKYILPDLRSPSLNRGSLPDEYGEYSYLLRNGGPVLHTADGTIRILQESTQNEYGHNLIFRQIVNDGDFYKEKELYKLFPEDIPVSLPAVYRMQGTHTYSIGKNYESADLSFTRPHPGNLFYNRK